jgi:hypothetical protein
MASPKLRLLSLGEGRNSSEITGLTCVAQDVSMRGLSSLFLLKQLMETLNHDDPPTPYGVFDMIGGTSPGGYNFLAFEWCACSSISLITIMLGRLWMDVDACIDAYATFLMPCSSAFRRIPQFDAVVVLFQEIGLLNSRSFRILSIIFPVSRGKNSCRSMHQ